MGETSTRSVRDEVDWASLDKTKFFCYGLGLFSAATGALYPLSVIKTRQMALDNAPKGLHGAFQTAAKVVRTDGIVGLYRGFVPSVVGSIPTRMIYLGTLEAVKSAVRPHLATLQLSGTSEAFAANFIAGGTASLTAQAVVVPLDVVTQRLMLGRDAHVAARPVTASAQVRGAAAAVAATAHAGQHHVVGPIAMVRTILHTDGIRGLYRGFGMSLATFVPSSSVWWACYAMYQRLIWHVADARRRDGRTDRVSTAVGGTGVGHLGRRMDRSVGEVGQPNMGSSERQTDGQTAELGRASFGRMDRQTAAQSLAGAGIAQAAALAEPNCANVSGAGQFSGEDIFVGIGQQHPRTVEQVMAVQAASAVLAGGTASLATNPLDVIKTRIQTGRSEGGRGPTIRNTVRQLLEAEGPRGFLRGVAPRMAASALWGTVMVSCYEFLKRLCVMPVDN